MTQVDSAVPEEFGLSFIQSNSSLYHHMEPLDDFEIPYLRAQNVLSPLKISRDPNESKAVKKFIESLQEITGSEHSKLQYLNMQ